MQQQEEIQKLKAHLTDFLKTEKFSVKPLYGGASVRRYYTLNFSDHTYFPNSRVILMHIPEDYLEMADDFLNISFYFKRHRIAHPRVYEIHRKRGWIFLEPAAGEQLDLYLNAHPEEMAKVYPRLLNFLINLQKRSTPEINCPAYRRHFDKEKYLFEFRFHVEEQLVNTYWGYRFTDAEKKVFYRFSQEVSSFLHSQAKFFVHRDFQSSNIFYAPDSSDSLFQVIDFQDARSGGMVYDLVSMVWDSYVDIPPELRTQLVEQFFRQQPAVARHLNKKQYRKTVDYTIIQRKLHDAGAFAYNYNRTGKHFFLKYLNPAVGMALSVMEKYPNFAEMAGIFQKLLQEHSG